MKQGDIGHERTFVIKDASGNIVDLTSLDTATLVAKVGSTRWEGECTVVDAASGTVKYIFVEGNLTKAGTYQFEVNIVMTDGDEFTSSRITEVVEAKL